MRRKEHRGSRSNKKERTTSKDGPGTVMVSNSLCPAVHILGTKNVHIRAKGTADHYWPWAVFFKILKFRQGSRPKGDNVL